MYGNMVDLPTKLVHYGCFHAMNINMWYQSLYLPYKKTSIEFSHRISNRCIIFHMYIYVYISNHSYSIFHLPDSRFHPHIHSYSFIFQIPHGISHGTDGFVTVAPSIPSWAPALAAPSGDTRPSRPGDGRDGDGSPLVMSKKTSENGGLMVVK